MKKIIGCINTAIIFFTFLISCVHVSAQTADTQTDPVADNMLLYQRSVGGWPKAVGTVKVDYHRVLSEGDRMATIEDGSRNDATIDNDATFKEINYLIVAYRKTNNETYLHAAEKGIRYLLKAQYANGGWPQFYPDASLYRSQVTYNDDAMIHAMTVLWNVAHRENGFDVVDPSLVAPSTDAVERGIKCILLTQIRVKGKLTVWCQQYNKDSLTPEMARKFELVGLSGAESVGIVEFLMKIKDPSPEIKNAIESAVQWFEAVKIAGYRFDRIRDPKQQTGRDGVLVPDENSTVWARYYEIETNRPFFSGRDSFKRYKLTEIENERRAGYAWYGTWPRKLLEKDYPEWKKKNG